MGGLVVVLLLVVKVVVVVVVVVAAYSGERDQGHVEPLNVLPMPLPPPAPIFFFQGWVFARRGVRRRHFDQVLDEE